MDLSGGRCVSLVHSIAMLGKIAAPNGEMLITRLEVLPQEQLTPDSRLCRSVSLSFASEAYTLHLVH